MFANIIQWIQYFVFLFHRLTQKNNTIAIRFSPPRESGKMITIEFVPKRICDLFKYNAIEQPTRNSTKSYKKQYTETRLAVNKIIINLLVQQDPVLNDENMSEYKRRQHLFYETFKMSEAVCGVYVNEDIKPTMSKGAAEFNLMNYNFIDTIKGNCESFEFLGE